MQHKQLIFAIIAYSFLFVRGYAQTGDPYTKNVAVIGRDKFGKPDGSGDVWRIKIAGNPDKHHALATIHLSKNFSSDY